jgi:uncharacterized protein YkwD
MSRSVIWRAGTVTLPILAIGVASVFGSGLLGPGKAAPTVANGPHAHLSNRLEWRIDRLEALSARGATPSARPNGPPSASVASRPAAQPARPVVARPAPPRPPTVTVGGAAGQEFALVNQDRVANGVGALSSSGALARVAQYRAQDMLNRNYFSHYDPATGQLAFLQLFRLWGIGYSAAGENIAWSTNPSMAGINTMFMNSPEHRANILNPAYHHLGIGVASNGAKTIVVEVFSN